MSDAPGAAVDEHLSAIPDTAYSQAVEGSKSCNRQGSCLFKRHPFRDWPYILRLHCPQFREGSVSVENCSLRSVNPVALRETGDSFAGLSYDTGKIGTEDAGKPEAGDKPRNALFYLPVDRIDGDSFYFNEQLPGSCYRVRKNSEN